MIETVGFTNELHRIGISLVGVTTGGRNGPPAGIPYKPPSFDGTYGAETHDLLVSPDPGVVRIVGRLELGWGHRLFEASQDILSRHSLGLFEQDAEYTSHELTRPFSCGLRQSLLPVRR